ncbi:MAG: 6-bladed beta-propeller [Muribaculaceae bacterium]|nr:6-bladed beta-propeller [Muribaculaceae bacterium]
MTRNNCLAKSMIIAVIALVACSRQSANESLTTINVDITDINEMLIDSAGIVPLEVNDSSLLYGVDKLILTDGKYIIHSRAAIKTFDAKTGRHLYNISQKGEGPGEYLSLFKVWIIGDTLHLLDSDKRSVLLFDIDGSYLYSIAQKYPSDDISVPKANFLFESPYGNGYFSQNRMVGGNPENYVDNYSLFDKDFNYLHDIKGRKATDSSFSFESGYTDREHMRMLVWDSLKDTIFNIEEDRVYPLFAINYGSNSMSNEERNGDSYYERAIAFMNNDSYKLGDAGSLRVKDGYLYFTFIDNKESHYICRYNEATGQSKVYKLVDPNGRYYETSQFEINGDKAMVWLMDQIDTEANPAIYTFNLSAFN